MFYTKSVLFLCLSLAGIKANAKTGDVIFIYSSKNTTFLFFNVPKKT